MVYHVITVVYQIIYLFLDVCSSFPQSSSSASSSHSAFLSLSSLASYIFSHSDSASLSSFSSELRHFIQLLHLHLHRLDHTRIFLDPSMDRNTHPQQTFWMKYFLDPAAVISTTAGVSSLAAGNINGPRYLNVFLHPETCVVFEEGGEAEVKGNFW